MRTFCIYGILIYLAAINIAAFSCTASSSSTSPQSLLRGTTIITLQINIFYG